MRHLAWVDALVQDPFVLLANVVVAAICSLGVVLACWIVGRSTRRRGRAQALSPLSRSRALQVSAALGAVAVVALMAVPRWTGAPLSALLDPSSFSVLQYVSPGLGAMVVLIGVPLAVRRQPEELRVAGLRPRRLQDFVDRAALLLLAPLGAGLAVVGTAVWQSGSSTEIMLAEYVLTSDPHERVLVTQRDVGFSPGWKVLLAIAVTLVLLTIVSWLVLRKIRDAAPAQGNALTAGEVRLRQTLSSIVLVVSAAAQAATAALILLSAGASVQGASLWTSARYTPVRVMGSTVNEFHPAGVHQLQPEWAFATAELILGLVLLAVAAILVVRASRLVAAVSARNELPARSSVA